MDMRPKQYRDVKKASKVEKEKKSETFEQRAKRYMPFVAVTGLLATAGMVEATKTESNKATELADRMQRSSESLPERYVPTAEDRKQLNEFLEKMNNPPFYFGPKDAQAPSSGEISQSVMETHQREQDRNKEMEPSSVSEEKIAFQRSLVASLKENPELLQRFKKMLTERQQFAEQKTGRRLQAIPGSNPVCLDVSASQVEGSVVSSLPDMGLPGSMEKVTYHLDVKNNCPVRIDQVAYTINVEYTCPTAVPPITRPKFEHPADPSSVGVNEHSGMAGIKPKYSVFGCEVLENDVPVSVQPPSSLTITVSADGTDQNTISTVYSPDKKFKVI